MRAVFIYRNVLHVVRLGTTKNAKIAPNQHTKVVQTFHFSRAQYDAIEAGTVTAGTLQARGLTWDNCMDCPLAANGCYVDKGVQALGLVSMLRSIVRQYPTWSDVPRDIPTYTCAHMATDRYVRFGTYGEPVLLPYPLVSAMVTTARSHTGYTHQWANPLAAPFRRYFMASTDDDTAGKAEAQGWREFYARGPAGERRGRIGCPASKEAGYRSNCAKCHLCNGTDGLASKSVVIDLH